MSGFAVNPQDVQNFVGVLDNQEAAAGSAARYLAHYATLPEETADSVFARVAVHHTDIYNAVSQGLHNAGKAISGSASGMSAVKQTYQNTDLTLASRIDGTIQAASRPDRPFGDQPSAAPLPDATNGLKPPDVPDDYPNPIEPVNQLLDAVSGATFAQHVVTQLLGWNPYERYATAFAGDWRAFGRAGIAFGSAGTCMWQVGDNIGTGNQALGRTWQGNAADAAFSYFNGLANDVRFFADAVSGLEQPYREVADSAYGASKGIADLLHTLTDDVMIVIAAVASGSTLEVAMKLLHILPEFVKHFLEKLGAAMAVAELLTGLARNIQASADLKDKASYVYGNMNDAAYKPPPQLVH